MYFQRLQKFALLEVIDPRKIPLSPAASISTTHLLASITWKVKSHRTKDNIDYSNQEMLEYISQSDPSSLGLTPSNLSVEVKNFARQEWEKRRLPVALEKLAISNNPFICVAIGILYMSTSEILDADGAEVILVASWLRVAALMVQHGSSPTFFTGLGAGSIRALPDLFCDLNISNKVTSTRKNCYESMTVLGNMIRNGKYEPSLSNILQMAMIMKRCSLSAVSDWTNGADVAIDSLSKSSTGQCAEIRPGLPKEGFSQILNASFDMVLASLCVGVFSGNANGNQIAPCIPLVITNGDFVGLKTAMLKWVVPPDLKHSLVFRAVGTMVEIACSPRQTENAWLRNVYLLNREDPSVLEGCHVFSDERYGDTQFVVKLGEIAFRTAPEHKKTITWSIDHTFDDTQNMNIHKTHAVLYQHGVHTIPLLGFQILTKYGHMANMDTGLKTWQKMVIS
jgi:hypothetical protein